MIGTESQLRPHSSSHPGTDALAELRRQVRTLEGFRETDNGGVTLGVPEIDEALPCGYLPTGVNHEFLYHSPEDRAATTGFVAALLSRLPQAPVVWITPDPQLYAPGFGRCGFDARRIITVAAKGREALWAMEEALRCKGLAAVVAEAAEADLTATRRLQLAAESSGVTGFLLRQNPRNSFSTACVTRWKISSAPATEEFYPAWHAELCRARGGRPAAWTLAWTGAGFALTGTPAPRQISTDFSPFLRAPRAAAAYSVPVPA
jgi:protein ImuA